MTRNNDTETEQTHDKDVFRPGDKVPWFGNYAVVTVRQVTEEIPDEVEDVNHPSEYATVEQDDEVPYVILTLDLPDQQEQNEALIPATWLYNHLGTSFSESGLPTVKFDNGRGVGVSGGISVQTPATGGNDLSPQEAEELAHFLRKNKDFGPLWKLLGRTDSERDMEEIADALNRAVTAERLIERSE